MAATPVFVSLSGEAKITGNAVEDFQVQNNNRIRGAVVAGGNTPVKEGAWYFEVRCVRGSPLIGWAMSGFSRPMSSGSCKDVFYIDFSKNSIIGGRRNVSFSSLSLHDGDIVGALIDFKSNCVSFSHNGEFVSGLKSDVSFGCRQGYVPIVELPPRGQANACIAHASFSSSLPKGTRAYVEALEKEASPEQLKQLGDIFDKFATQPDGSKCKEDQLLDLFKALGEEGDDDPIAFVFLWYVNRTTHDWEVSKTNFIKAFSTAKCTSIEQIQRTLRNTQKALMSHKGDDWTSFYRFVFGLLLENGSQMVAAEKAAGVWEVLGFGKWKFFGQWTAFIAEQQQKREKEVAARPPTAKRMDPELIGLDVWKSFPTFTTEFAQSFDDFDTLCYNTLFDEFVEYVQKH